MTPRHKAPTLGAVMGSIVRLPDAVANQIAAGEVVERPASVVKELVENALDAGARRVEVHVEGGGTGRITVTDDGVGMSPEDAVLCLERHATSKIRSAHDLETVRTMGFRGEAIPSIASVSRFTLTTRQAQDELATRIVVEGGRAAPPREVGAPAGTTIEVAELFYNVPARKKFLKSPATEMSHLSDAVVRLALARPDVGLRLLAEGRTLFDAPPATSDDPRGRLGRILGRPVAERLFAIPEDEAPRRIRTHGFVSAPDLSERTSRGLYTFVNGRFVRERTIQHAIQEAYRPLLEKGRYPVVVLFLELDPASLDVNVHPQKTEVRFESTTDVHRAVTGALARVLGAQPWLLGQLGPAPSATPARSYGLEAQGANAGPPIFSGHLPRHEGPGSDRPRSLHVPARPPNFEGKAAGRYLPDLGFGFGTRDRAPVLPLRPSAPEAPNSGAGIGAFAALEPIGQALGSYLVCQAPGRLVVIDQAAAHERVLLARLEATAAGTPPPIQPLLVPETLNLDPRRAQTIEAEAGALAEVGFVVEPFGPNTWLLKAAPAILGGVELRPLLLDLLDELAESDARSAMTERRAKIRQATARHGAIRPGTRLSPEEIRQLLVDLDQVGVGVERHRDRPVFLEWTGPELARMFYR